jgi:hypothetical protein
MPLNKPDLQTAIKTAFKKAKDTPPPSDPSQADQTQEQILTTLAQDLADAINTFVLNADVAQVTVQVKDNTSAVIGTGTQLPGSFGKLQ